MGGLRGGRGGGGGGGFERRSDSFGDGEARSDKGGCELFLGGGGGGGDESVGCCVVASILFLWRGVPRCDEYVTAVRASALYSCRHAAENLSAAQSAEDGVISAASLRPGRHAVRVRAWPTLEFCES